MIIEKVKIVVQINGKRRAEIETKINVDEETVMNEIKNIKNVNDQIANSKIIKKIFVLNKFLNIVVEKNE